jgi:hypothetical protein
MFFFSLFLTCKTIKNQKNMGKKKTGGQGLRKKDLEKMLIELFEQNPQEVYDLKTIYRLLHLSTHPAKMLCVDVLNEMLETDELVRNEEGELSLNAHDQVCEGVFNRTSGGRNFVDLPDGTGVSIYDEDGKLIDTVTIPFSMRGSASLVSSPAFKLGSTYTVKTKGYEKTFTLSEQFTAVR